jgi:bacterioferritin-associated ferredoxin
LRDNDSQQPLDAPGWNRGRAVYVCVCNALKERDVKQAARAAGTSCPHAAYAQLGAKVKCGQCLPFAREVVARASTYA